MDSNSIKDEVNKNKRNGGHSSASNDPNVVNSGASTSKSKPKFSFKRSADSGMTSSFPDSPSAKKAKFRAENPLPDLPKNSPLHRNKLCVFDTQYFSDYDTPPSSQNSDEIKPKTFRVSSKTSKVPSMDSTSKRKDATSKKESTSKLKDVPKDRTGVWLSTRDNSSQENGNASQESENVLQLSDSASDVEVEHIQEIESQLSLRSLNSSNHKANSKSSNQLNHSLSKPAEGGWINLSNKKNNSNSSNRVGKKTPMRNSGSSTLVVLDDEEIGDSASISRTSLTPSVSIGMLSSRGDSSSASRPSLSSVEGE